MSFIYYIYLNCLKFPFLVLLYKYMYIVCVILWDDIEKTITFMNVLGWSLVRAPSLAAAIKIRLGQIYAIVISLGNKKTQNKRSKFAYWYIQLHFLLHPSKQINTWITAKSVHTRFLPQLKQKFRTAFFILINTYEFSSFPALNNRRPLSLEAEKMTSTENRVDPTTDSFM